MRSNYNFEYVAQSLDELIILNVDRSVANTLNFIAAVEEVSLNCFIPLGLGGHIKSLQDAEVLISNGADKLIINSSIYRNPTLIKNLVSKYGSQAVVASIDFKSVDGTWKAFVDQGATEVDMPIVEYLQHVISLGVGELYLNSIDLDGTGQGYCLDIIQTVSKISSIPVIIAGGAGNKNHFLNALESQSIDGASTANLFNFIGEALPEARKHLIAKGINLSNWAKTPSNL
ncbi:HisA/HisF-related TIM barrel protein [Synechococcus sp. LTW-R]|uniref:HisA/HisF-related TIM barrel protein n=1 Tax=Synechococcus sp. LTW-R TaxID=2751170 RepID=UPI002106792E|nr:HisA/HisF-related TIM barrel protein [Synechococcus sp. LTW-R]